MTIFIFSPPILKQGHKVGLRSLLQGHDCGALESEVSSGNHLKHFHFVQLFSKLGSNLFANLPDYSGEWQLWDEKTSCLLKSPDLHQRSGPRPVPPAPRSPGSSGTLPPRRPDLFTLPWCPGQRCGGGGTDVLPGQLFTNIERFSRERCSSSGGLPRHWRLPLPRGLGGRDLGWSAPRRVFSDAVPTLIFLLQFLR